MPSVSRKSLVEAIVNDWWVKHEQERLEEAAEPKSKKAQLQAIRTGRKSPTRTEFRAHVELSESGAFVVWQTGTKKRGNTWRTRLPLEKLKEWDELVRDMQARRSQYEEAKAHLETAAWQACSRALSDQDVYEIVRAALRKLKQQTAR